MSERVARSRELVAEGHRPCGRGARAADQPPGDLPDADAAARRRSGGRRPTRSSGRSSRSPRTTRPTATGWSTALVRRRLGRPVNRKRVLRVMRERKLIQRRRPSRAGAGPGFFRVERPGQLWHLDMTSVWVAEHGWCYLNAIIDCCTREIVGWDARAALPRRRGDRASIEQRRRRARHPARAADARHRQRLRLHRPRDPARARRARHHPPPRRLPRPREPGVHRDLVPQSQGTLRLAQRVRDPRPGPGGDRRLHRPLPRPAPQPARLPNTPRGARRRGTMPHGALQNNAA